MYRETHSHIQVHVHTSRIHTATKSSKHTHIRRALSFLTLLVPLEAAPRSLCNPTSVKHATRRSILTFSFQENNEYAGACRQKKTRGRQSLALPDMGHIQRLAHRDNHILFHYTRERDREGWCKRIFRIPSVTYQDDGQQKGHGRCSLYTLSHQFSCVVMSAVFLFESRPTSFLYNGVIAE